MKKTFDWLLIGVGSFLEVYFYIARFGQEGIPPWLGCIMGVALNLLLLHAVHRDGWQFKTLALFLICFSVISTSAGQTFMLLEKGKAETEAKYSVEVAEIALEIETLTDERGKINAQIAGTVQTLEDRYEWKNTLAMAESRKVEIETQLKELRARRDAIVTGNVQTAGGAALYDFYSRLTGGRLPPDWLKLILHTALSVFIALMAPTGIYGLSLKDDKKTEDEQEAEFDLETWVRFMWRGMRKGLKGVPTADQMREYCYIAGVPFDPRKHEEWRALAEEKGLITPQNTLAVSGEYALKKMENKQIKLDK